MPTVSVLGMSGKSLLENFSIAPHEEVSALYEATRNVLGLAQPGLEVSLIFGVEVLQQDKVVGDTELTDGSILTAKVADILSALRLLTDLPTYIGSNVSEAAARGAWMDVVRLIEEGSALDATYEFGYSALMHLAACPHEYAATAQLDPLAASQIMRWILMRGANVMQLDNNRKCALHIWGKYGGCLEQGEVLLEFGADVNHEMKGGYTPLWYVRNYKRPQPPLDTGDVSGTDKAERRRNLDGAEAGTLWQEAEKLLVERGAVERGD